MSGAVRSLRAAVTAATLGAVAGGAAVGQQAGGQPVRKVLSDWEALRSRTKVVRYTVTGTVEQLADPEPSSKPLPKGPVEFPVGAVVLIDVDGGRVRIEETTRGVSRDGTRWAPEHRVTTYDKKDHRSILPAGRNDLGADPPHLAVSTGNLAYTKVDSHLWPVFMAHGIVPISGALLRFDHFPVGHDADELSLVGSVAHGGRSCVSIQSEPSPLTHEIWADTTRRSAVVRLTRWAVAGKAPSVRMDLSYRDGAGPPVLDRWAHTTFLGGRPILLTKYHVTAVETDAAATDAAFTIPAEVGMRVTEVEYPPGGSGLNPNLPSKRSYHVEVGGRQAQIGEVTGFTTWDGQPVPANPAGPWRWVWWGLGLCGAAVLFGVVRRRGRRPVSGKNTGDDAPPGADDSFGGEEGGKDRFRGK